MYYELIERLGETSIDFGESDHVSVMLIEAADAIEDLQDKFKTLMDKYIRLAAHTEWIPVTERLPDSERNVLCNDEGGVAIGYYIDEEIGWHDMHCYKIYPTHWMPLPPPPIEDIPMEYFESEGE